MDEAILAHILSLLVATKLSPLVGINDTRKISVLQSCFMFFITFNVDLFHFNMLHIEFDRYLLSFANN
jgi:hypothetical protein